MDDMNDIDEIRRDNIRLIESEMGSPAITAKAIGMGLAQYLNLRDGAKDSRTGVPRGMRKQTAWKIEDGTGKPRGWLDIPHAGNSINKTGYAIGSDEYEFIEKFRLLSQERKQVIKQTLETFLALEQYEFIQGTMQIDAKNQAAG